jgi:hypothetical protein
VPSRTKLTRIIIRWGRIRKRTATAPMPPARARAPGEVIVARGRGTPFPMLLYRRLLSYQRSETRTARETTARTTVSASAEARSPLFFEL